MDTMLHATAAFTFAAWDQDVYDARPGADLSRTHIEKVFTGDFVGTSVVESLMCTTAVEGSAAYVGFERFVGRLHGREGTFVLHHTATGSGGERTGSWTVVPDTGTGALTGLRGSATIVIDADGGHVLELDYAIG